MKLLVLMGGNRSLDSSSSYPLYLTEIDGKLIIEDVCKTYNCQNFSDIIFCIKKEDINSFNTDSIVQSIVPQAKIIELQGLTSGAPCTALLAKEYIETDENLLVVSIDDYIDCNVKQILDEFVEKNIDVGLVSFPSVHPRYSFVRRDENGEVCQISEKKPVSREALASFYYFKHGRDFVLAVENCIRKDNRINGSFYISQALNEFILLQKQIYVHKIESAYFHSFKTERQLAAYIANYQHDKDVV